MVVLLCALEEAGMKTLITGNGRSGTCWMSAIIRKTGLHDSPCPFSEDRGLYIMGLFDGYLGKLCIENRGVTVEMFEQLLKDHEDLNIIWCFRNPISTALSKVNRGRNIETGEVTAIDGTPEGACEWVRKSVKMYSELKYKFPNNLLSVKMENLILNGINEIKRILLFLGYETDDEGAQLLLESYNETWNLAHKERYKTIDKSQAYIADNIETSFDGYFADKPEWVKYIKENLADLVEMYK